MGLFDFFSRDLLKKTASDGKSKQKAKSKSKAEEKTIDVATEAERIAAMKRAMEKRAKEKASK